MEAWLGALIAMRCGANLGLRLPTHMHGTNVPSPPVPPPLTPEDITCPICVETITDPFVTSCGHTFCYKCITTHLKHKSSCPSCSNYLTQDHIYPNFLLNKVTGLGAGVWVGGWGGGAGATLRAFL